MLFSVQNSWLLYQLWLPTKWLVGNREKQWVTAHQVNLDFRFFNHPSF
jgi:hypothetical protein